VSYSVSFGNKNAAQNIPRGFSPISLYSLRFLFAQHRFADDAEASGNRHFQLLHVLDVELK